MNIQWYGQSCFKITTKKDSQETTIITDPTAEELGLKSGKMATDIVTFSLEDKKFVDHKIVKGTTASPEPFVIKGPGEYEYKNVFVYGLPSTQGTSSKEESESNFSPTKSKTNNSEINSNLYVFSIEGMMIAHLGGLRQKELSIAQLDRIEGADILMVPVGGNYTLNAKEAVKLVNQVEPRLVIPMHYKIPGLKIKLDPVDDFIREYGVKPEEMDRLRLSKKDLPQDQTRLIILKS